MSKMKAQFTAQQAADARAARFHFAALGVGLIAVSLFLSSFWVDGGAALYTATAALVLLVAALVCFLLSALSTDPVKTRKRPHAVSRGPVNRPRVDVAPAEGCRAALVNAPSVSLEEINGAAAFLAGKGKQLKVRINGSGANVYTVGKWDAASMSYKTYTINEETVRRFSQYATFNIYTS